MPPPLLSHPSPVPHQSSLSLMLNRAFNAKLSLVNSPSGADPLNMMDTNNITPIPEEGTNPLDKEGSPNKNNNNQKKKDLNFGFDILKLDQSIAEKATRLMESEFQNHVGPAGKRKKRQQMKEEERKQERIAREQAEKEAAEAALKEDTASPTNQQNALSPKALMGTSLTKLPTSLTTGVTNTA